MKYSDYAVMAFIPTYFPVPVFDENISDLIW